MLTDDLQYLPVELQATLVDMRAAGTSDDRLNRLILLILADREAKVTGLQMELVKIHDSINTQIGRNYDKLRDDLRTQNGATNQMIVDTLGIVQRLEAATGGLRAEFHNGLAQVGERLNENDLWRAEVDQERASFRQSRDASIADRRRHDHDMAESKEHRAHIQQTLDTELPAIKEQIGALAEAVQRIEAALALNGQHTEAGG